MSDIRHILSAMLSGDKCILGNMIFKYIQFALEQ